MTQSKYMSVPEVAEVLNIPIGMLRMWRHRGQGPRSFKMVGCVRYDREDVESWLESQEQATRTTPRGATEKNMRRNEETDQKAEQELNAIAIQVAEFVLVSDGECDFYDRGLMNLVEEEVPDVLISKIINVLLRNAGETEKSLLETGQACRSICRPMQGLILDPEEHIEGVIGTGIFDSSGVETVVDLEMPFVRKLAALCDGLSVIDKIRVFTQLVLVYRETVGYDRDLANYSAEFVGNFRLSVDILREAVRAYRDYEATEPAKHPDGSEQN